VEENRSYPVTLWTPTSAARGNGRRNNQYTGILRLGLLVHRWVSLPAKFSPRSITNAVTRPPAASMVRSTNRLWK